MANSNGPVLARCREDQERERFAPADLLQCCDRTLDPFLDRQTQNNSRLRAGTDPRGGASYVRGTG